MRAHLFFAAIAAGIASTAAQSVQAPTDNVVEVPQTAQPVQPPTQRVEVNLRAAKPLPVQTMGSGSPAWIAALITGIASLITSLIALGAALLVVARSNRQSAANSRETLALAEANARAATNQKANEVELERIEHWLASFLGPYMQISEENKRIAELLRSRQSNPDFRTLKGLLDPAWLRNASETDLNLISRIVDTGCTLRGLIREKAGPVHSALAPYLARAAAHFTILELANAGALKHDTASFDRDVYPRQLDPVLQLERERLEARRDQLLADLSKQHDAAPPLLIPKKLRLDEPARAP